MAAETEAKGHANGALAGDTESASQPSGKRVPRAVSRLKVNINGKEYTASDWNHTGCKIQEYEGRLDKGSMILIKLHMFGLNSETRIKCQAEVMWVRNNDIGLKFETLPLYEQDIVTHQLREALNLVGKRRDDFNISTKPAGEIELENVHSVRLIESLAVGFTGLIVRLAKYKGIIIVLCIFVAVILAAFYASSNEVNGRGTVVTDVEVVPATENGTLMRLLVKESHKVRAGAPLFITRDEDLYKTELSKLNQYKRDLDESQLTHRIMPNLHNSGSENYQSLVDQYRVQLEMYSLYHKLFDIGAVTRESVLEKKKELFRLKGEISIAISNQQLITPYKDLYNKAQARFNAQLKALPNQSESQASSIGPMIYKIYYSPVNGIVLKLPRFNGSSLLKGSTLSVIQPTDSPPTVRVFLPHSAADRLSIGSPATISVVGDAVKYDGFVTSIEKRGGLKLRVTDNQMDDLFEHNSSLQETPTEVLLKITKQDSQVFPVLNIGAKASVTIKANNKQTLIDSLRNLISFAK
jgi:multidrug resistance efflux pump